MLKTVSSIANAIGALNYKGTWDANANSPALTSSAGTKGDYYVVGTAGSTNLNGISNWGIGDWAVFNGSVWQRVEGGANLNGVDLSVSGISQLTGNATFSNNLVQGTAAKGVNFTANTPAAGMTSQLLNWYEEGTFTPTMSFGGGTTGITYGTQLGRYTRIGREVTVHIYLVFSSKGSSTGAAKIASLPFTTPSGDAFYSGITFGYFQNITYTGMLTGHTDSGASTVSLLNTTLLGVSSTITDANFADNSNYIVSMTYCCA